jgi:hypothetical protein
MFSGVGFKPPAAVQYALDIWMTWTSESLDLHTQKPHILFNTTVIMTRFSCMPAYLRFFSVLGKSAYWGVSREYGQEFVCSDSSFDEPCRQLNDNPQKRIGILTCRG